MPVRLIREIPNPDPYTILEATFGQRPYLIEGEEVWSTHMGEDGPGVTLVTYRDFSLERQCEVPFSQLRNDWFRSNMDMMILEMGYWEDLYGPQPDQYGEW